MKYLLFAALLALTATPVHATEFQCSRDNDKRIIRFEYPGLQYLCEVTVTKTNDERKVVWYANFDSNFCSNKIIELTDKYQQQWGFTCSRWPDRHSLEGLNDGQRALLDSFIKNKVTEADQLSPPEIIRAVRAFPIGDNTDSGVLAQLFVLNSDNDPESRLYALSHSGESHDATVLGDLLGLIAPVARSTQLTSAIIDTITPAGHLAVNTTLRSTHRKPQESPDCFGQQNFSLSDNNVLKAANEHQFSCIKHENQAE